MTLLHVYRDGAPMDVDLDTDASLASTRSTLTAAGKMSNEYQFVYWNVVTKQKTVFNNVGREAATTLQACVLPGDNLILANVGTRPDLFGDRCDWFHDRNTGVRVRLNTEAAAAGPNSGKFEPLLLNSVQPANQESHFFADNVVVCEKGSVVSLDVSSWGAAGFGFSITSQHDTIADGLYATYGRPNGPPYGSQTTMSLGRWMSSQNMIQIDSTSDMNITSDLVVQYQKITVKTWNVTAFTDGSGSYSSNLKPPSPTSMPMRPTGGFAPLAMAAVANASNGFDPGPPGGDIYVPGSGVQPGVPHQGPPSSETFAGGLKSITADTSVTGIVGSVVFYFFVFRDKATANAVMQLNNSLDPSVYQN